MVETRSGTVLTPQGPRRPSKTAANGKRFTPFGFLGVALLALAVLPPLAPLHFVRSSFSGKAFGPKASTFSQALGAAKAVKDRLAEGEASAAAQDASKAAFELVKSFVWPFGQKRTGLYATLRDSLPGGEATPAEKLQAAWQGLYTDDRVPTLWKTLVHYACSGLASAGLLSLVLHGAALRDRLHLDLFRRLLQALFTFGTVSASVVALNYEYISSVAYVSGLSVFLTVAALAGFYLSKKAPAKKVFPIDPVPHTARGATYGVLTTFTAVAALLILLLPKATLEGTFGIHGGAVGRILWQLNATGVHTLVSFCLLNLKPLAERHHLNSVTSAVLNGATIYPGLIYLLGALRAHIAAGLSGVLLPVLVLTWLTATIFATINLPATIKAKRFD